MSITTLKALNRVTDSGVGRSDLYTVHPDKLEIESGYNVRDAYHPEYWESDLAKGRIAALSEAYQRGDHVDPITVEVVDGHVYVRSGEHRTRAIRQAISEGWECEKVRVIQMDVPREGKKVTKPEDIALARLMILTTGNSGSPLSPIQQGAVYKKMRQELKMSDIEIANKVGVTREYVRICRAYLAMPEELIQMSAKGEIAPKRAYRLFRLHGDLAISIAKGDLEAPKVESPAAIKRKETEDAVTELRESVEDLGNEVLKDPVVQRLVGLVERLSEKFGFNEKESK